jgi:hypothetical protein
MQTEKYLEATSAHLVQPSLVTCLIHATPKASRVHVWLAAPLSQMDQNADHTKMDVNTELLSALGQYCCQSSRWKVLPSGQASGCPQKRVDQESQVRVTDLSVYNTKNKSLEHGHSGGLFLNSFLVSPIGSICALAAEHTRLLPKQNLKFWQAGTVAIPMYSRRERTLNK